LQYAVVLLPAIAVGLWETIRHQDNALHAHGTTFGNILLAIVVFILTLVIQRTLMIRLRNHERKLQQAELEQARLQAREEMAAQLHDGLAQSLFLLSVQVEQLAVHQAKEQTEAIDAIRQTMHHLNQDVRMTISHLRLPQERLEQPLENVLYDWMMQRVAERNWQLDWNWNLPLQQICDTLPKQLAMQSIIKEIIWNGAKHSQAQQWQLVARGNRMQWRIDICQSPNGWQPQPNWYERKPGQGFGLAIVYERAVEQGWDCVFHSEAEKLTFCLSGGEEKRR
jgi:two-component system nitrate/nitrite sensor histidine kinase NarQ